MLGQLLSDDIIILSDVNVLRIVWIVTISF